MKKLLSLFLMLILLLNLCLTSCEYVELVLSSLEDETPEEPSEEDITDLLTPTIDRSDDGYWVINGIKTDRKAVDQNGKPYPIPKVEISDDGYIVINGIKTQYKADGSNNEPKDEPKDEPKVEYVTVTFVVDADIDMPQQTVPKGSKVTKPADPQMKGYTFDAWYTDDGQKFSFEDSVVTEDTVLMGKFNINKYTLEFYSMGTLLSPTFTMEYGTLLNAPELPPVDGYYLEGWYTESGKKWDFEKDYISENTKLHANWKVVTYRVYYVHEGEIVHYEVVERGKKATYPNRMIGFDDTVKWMLETGEIWDFSAHTVTEDITLYAVIPDATYTYRTSYYYTPTNWNPLSYFDENDLQIINQISSSLFSYDYKFENGQKFLPDGSINTDGIIDGAFTVNYDAATGLEDVTATVDEKWGYTAEQKAEGGYAWKITLRDDLKWHDGTPITAEDFVYSMNALFDPDFMNQQATRLHSRLPIKNVLAYFYKNQSAYYEPVASMGFTSNDEARANGYNVYVRPSGIFTDVSRYVDENGHPMPEWITGDTVYAVPEDWRDYRDSIEEFGFSANLIFDAYEELYLDVGCPYASEVAVRIGYDSDNMTWDDVGVFTVSGENAFVICLDSSHYFLTDDGSLSSFAAYCMSSIPLVKRDLYEANRIAPSNGYNLWTSSYNTSLETSASWGPYMLVEFHSTYCYYILKKNPYWHGWNMETYRGQYSVDTIYCTKENDDYTLWKRFIRGEFDDAQLDLFDSIEYLDSKYLLTYEDSPGSYAVHLYSNLEVLKASDNNNGILAITEFRQAINFAIDRDYVTKNIWTGSTAPCLGLTNGTIYYDFANAPSLYSGGIYRNTTQAKAALLRVYGYTEAADSTWSRGELTGLTMDEAYATLTGYDLDLAKEKMRAAIAELTENADYYGYDATKDIILVFGASNDSDKQRYRADYFRSVINSLVEGTALEGKIIVKFDCSAGTNWANALRSGKTQIGFGYGYNGSSMDVCEHAEFFIYPDGSLNYHPYWNTDDIELTITLPVIDGVSYEGEGQTVTMSALNWAYCLLGDAQAENQVYTYNFSDGYAPAEARITIFAALEETVLKNASTIMMIADVSYSLRSAKFSLLTDKYVPYLEFGGIRYLMPEYTDAEWDAFVKANGGNLSAEYKKSE